MEALGVINTTVAPYITNAINSESIRHIDQSTYIVFIQVLFLLMEGVINTTVAPYIHQIHKTHRSKYLFLNKTCIMYSFAPHLNLL